MPTKYKDEVRSTRRWWGKKHPIAGVVERKGVVFALGIFPYVAFELISLDEIRETVLPNYIQT
jgi:hypothetical protein